MIRSPMLLVGAVAAVLLIAVCSTGRTVASMAVALFLVSYWIAVRTGLIRSASLVTAAVIVILLGALVETPYLVQHADNIVTKFDLKFGESHTGQVTTEEARIEEVELMFEELRGYELTGLGLGSSFIPIGFVDLDTGESRQTAPHIGILAPLFKGGAIAFLAVCIIPAYLALRRFFFSSLSDAISLSIWGGVLVSLMVSCMSGGYTQGSMFIFGMLISMGLNWDDEHTASMRNIEIA